jgi:hypothetical protein
MKLHLPAKSVPACLIAGLFLQSCAVLTDSQVKNINAFAASTKAYCTFPAAVVRQRAELHLTNELIVASEFTDTTAVYHRLNNARKSYDDALTLAPKFDLSLQLIQQYGELLTKLSSDHYLSDLNTPATALGTNLDLLISSYNSKAKDSLPAELGSDFSKVLLFVGKELTKRKQTKLLKEFVLAADTMIQVTTRNLVRVLEGESFTDSVGNRWPTLQSLISLEREEFVNSYRNIVFSKPAKIDYLSVKTYYDGITDYDNTEALRSGVVKAAKSLALAQAALVQNIQTKKDLKAIIGETQQLVTDCQSAGAAFSRYIKLP